MQAVEQDEGGAEPGWAEHLQWVADDHLCLLKVLLCCPGCLSTQPQESPMPQCLMAPDALSCQGIRAL